MYARMDSGGYRSCHSGRIMGNGSAPTRKS